MKEASLWELGLESSHLTAVFDYAVRDGAQSVLAFDLPHALEVETVRVAPKAPCWRG